ncbi:MAG: GspE/PulE family protein [Gemmatimonadetes bacterium]|nr:GspE/PulE family protein [Gemmatimonadota bacterium]
MKKKLLGERLLESGLIQERQLAQALQAQQSTGEQLGRLLVRLGYLKDDDLLRLLCEDAGIDFSTLESVEPELAALHAVPEALARSLTILPLSLTDGRVRVALADPFELSTITAAERSSGLRVSVVGAPRAKIQGAIERAYRNAPRQPRGSGPAPEANAGIRSGLGSSALVTNTRSESVSESPDAGRDSTESGGTAAGIADEVFERGVALGATDIHIEPTTAGVEVRYRLDGILRKGPSFPKNVQGPLITRIKVLAGLNIAESRLPQDGRLRITASGREIDLRVSTFPTLQGEDLVLRILDRARVPLRLSGLGFADGDLAMLREVLARPLGLVLLTGPTGSGKTTTLYSALSELNTGERCILTIEDPVEYEVEGIRQSQINPRSGLTFSSGLRSMLRHDPDVILVGEIRDLDTAQIALSAAMTGHMVLSTIHTNSAAAALPRLLDMGTEPFALASSLQLSVAQRLVRALCLECRQPTDVPVAVRRRFSLGDVQLYRPGGCARCGRTGYRGRGAIFEFLPVNEAVTKGIFERKSAEDIQRLGGRPTLFDAGLEKVRNGSTTLEELLRVVSL